ncbi:MAG: DUF3597 domain-containing protein [Pseudomonadota bacterium]
MSVFGNILSKIFNHKPAAASGAARPAASPSPSAAGTAAAAPASAPSTIAPGRTAPPAAQTSPAAQVDVAAVLTEMAALQPDGGGNWRTSIVDLLRLLGLDSSLGARRELAQELGIHTGDDGTAEQNIALHKAVMKKLADNGGIVPDSMRD